MSARVYDNNAISASPSSFFACEMPAWQHPGHTLAGHPLTEVDSVHLISPPPLGCAYALPADAPMFQCVQGSTHGQ